MMRRIRSARTIVATALGRLRHKPRAAYIGWAGHGNLGDDVMLTAASRLVGESLEVLQSPRLESLLAKAGVAGPRLFARAFLGGGTLINRDYLPAVESTLARGLRIASLGTGVGSAGFSMAEGGLDPRWIAALRRFEGVGVRGPLSQEKLASGGLRDVAIVGDLALVHTPEQAIADYASRRFVVNCAPARDAADSMAMDRANAALANVVRELACAGWDPIPVAFDRADRQPLVALMAGAGLSGLPIAAPVNMAEYRAIASRASLSIGVRLHSAVLAAACGVVPVLIGYRDKCRDFAASINDERMVVPLDAVNGDVLLNVTSDAISQLERLGRDAHDRCRHLRVRLVSFADGLAPVP